MKIRTERLLIIPFQEKHLNSTYIGWLNDPETVKYSSQRHVKHTIESCRNYWNSFIGTNNFFWAIETNEDNNHIGNINAYLDIYNSTADIGILIGAKNNWGKGYGLEAWNGVIKFLFEVKGIRKITAGTLSSNIGMINIALRSGMKEEGRSIKQEIVNNVEMDIIYYGLFNKLFYKSS